MNKLFLLILLLFTFTKLPAQKKLAGTVYMYHENGNNTTLAGAIIKTAGGGTTYTTHTKGYYELEFDGNVDVARIFASKSGMEVINQESLDRIDLKKNSNQNIYFDIDGNTRKRRNAIEEAALRANKEKIKELEAKNKQAYELKKILERKYDTTFSDIDQLIAYEIELYNRNKKTIEELAQLLVRINLDHDNEQAEQLLHLFKIGEIDSARRLFDVMEFVKDVEVLLTQIDKKKEVGLAAIPILLASNDYDAVDTVYKYLLKIDSENVDMSWQYGKFLAKQNRLNEAEKILSNILNVIDSNEHYTRANVLNSLGVIMKSNNTSGAVDILSEALRIRRYLAQKNPAVYLPDVSITLSNIGAIYETNNDFEKAGIYYKEALSIIRPFALENPEIYLPKQSIILNNLGLFYKHNNNIIAAIAYYEEALDVRRKIGQSNSENLSSLAIILNNLGALHQDIYDTANAYSYYCEAYNIYRQLSQRNPDAYLHDLAGSLNNLGILRENDTAFASACYSEAIMIYRRLAQKNPKAYLSDLATTLYNMGSFRSYIYDTVNAIIALNEALEIIRKHAKINPDKHLPDLANVLNNIGNLKTDIRSFEEAGLYYSESLEIRRQLAKKKPEVFLPDVVNSLNNIGMLHRRKDNLPNAIIFYNEAIEIKRRLASENPDMHLAGLAMILSNLANAYSISGFNTKASENYSQAVSIYRIISKNKEYHLLSLAKTLRNFGSHLESSGESELALKCYNEALNILKKYTIPADDSLIELR